MWVDDETSTQGTLRVNPGLIVHPLRGNRRFTMMIVTRGHETRVCHLFGPSPLLQGFVLAQDFVVLVQGHLVWFGFQAKLECCLISRNHYFT